VLGYNAPMKNISKKYLAFLLAPFLFVLGVVHIASADHGHNHTAYAENLERLTIRESILPTMSLPSESYEMAYLDTGVAREGTYLMLHGIPTSSWMYRELVPEVAGRGYRVVAPDLLGFGASSTPEIYEYYGPDQQAQYVSELLENLGIKKVNLVVHDMGSLVGWEMLIVNEIEIESIVVLDSIVDEFKAPRAKKGGIISWFMKKAYMNPGLAKRLIKATLKKGGALAELNNGEIEEYIRPYSKDAGDGAGYATWHFFTDFDRIFTDRMPMYHDALLNFNGKITTIWGSDDAFLKPDIHLEKLKALRSDNKLDRYTEIADAPHYILETHRDEVINHMFK